jgi:hypothetical protein
MAHTIFSCVKGATMVKWFRCFAEVSGVGYKGHPSEYRPRLPEQVLLPKSGAYEGSNAYHEYLTWPMLSGTGVTSASPVKQWTTQARSGESPAQTRLRQLYETLELPGELLDYHFALQGCCSELWRLRREELWVFGELEQLCWLDTQLIQTYPDIMRVPNERNFLVVTTLQHLIALYEQEGYLYEALQVAEIAVKFNQQMPALERIQSRIATIEAEEAG